MTLADPPTFQKSGTDETPNEETQPTTPTTTEEPAASRDELEKKTADRMAKIFGNEPEENEESDDAGGDPPQDENEPPAGSESGEGDEGDVNDGAEEAAEDGEDGSDASDPDAPTLPDAYRRSLAAYGWKPEEIEEELKTYGSRFISTAARIHENRNAELAAMAQKGRQAREQREQGDGPPTQQPQNAGGLQALKPIDVKQFKERYGDDDMIEDMVAPLNATIEAVNAILPQLQQGQQTVQQAELDTLRRSVEKFFDAPEMRPYAQAYGRSTETLTESQKAERNKVLEVADALVRGYQDQGRSLGIEEALMLAHDTVAKPVTEAAVRSKIGKEAKKRGRGLSLKPSNRGGTPLERTGTPRSREELESRTRARLRTVFNSR